MSHDYFTNRQDRYITFHNKDITEYYNDLVSVVSSLSYSLQEDNNTFKLSMDTDVPDPVKNSKDYKSHANKTILGFLKKWSNTQQIPKDATYDTTLYPLVQMGPFGVRQDERVTLSVLDHVLHAREQSGNAKMFITSGYFNFEKRYSRAIVNSKSSDVCLIAASPEVCTVSSSERLWQGDNSMTDNIYLMVNAGKWILQLCRHLKVHPASIHVNREKVLQQGESSGQWRHHFH